MSFLPTAGEVWRGLERKERFEASEALWSRSDGVPEAVLELAQLWRMRPPSVLKTPRERRVAALAGLIRPSESVALSLLAALHLAKRRPLLIAFLEALEIPHEDGMLSDEMELKLPEVSRIVEVGLSLIDKFGAEQVRTYWTTLWLQDREVWEPLRAAWAEIEQRLGPPKTGGSNLHPSESTVSG